MAADFCRLATAALLLGWRVQLSSCACVVKGTLCRPGSYKSESGQLKAEVARISREVDVLRLLVVLGSIELVKCGQDKALACTSLLRRCAYKNSVGDSFSLDMESNY